MTTVGSFTFGCSVNATRASGRATACKRRIVVAGIVLLFSSACSSASPEEQPVAVAWNDSRNYLSQEPGWYATADAIQIADNLLRYQQESGGWPPLHSRIRSLAEDSSALHGQEQRTDAWIIATARKLRFLGRVREGTSLDRFDDAIERGIDYLADAQYVNGGFPKVFPDTLYGDDRDSSHNPRNRAVFITINDGSMPLAVDVLLDAARGEAGFAFLDSEYRERARSMTAKGTKAFLDLQIEANGRRTGWAQYHDEVTLEPHWGRKFEPVSIAASESADVVAFLMRLEEPMPPVIDAIQSAMDWFDEVKVTGVRQVEDPEPIEVDNYNGTRRFTDRHEVTLAEDPDAPPIWARFYEIGTNRPVFASEDDTVRYSMAEISVERRTGYDWYGGWPRRLLAEEYPAWLSKHGLESVPD